MCCSQQQQRQQHFLFRFNPIRATPFGPPAVDGVVVAARRVPAGLRAPTNGDDLSVTVGVALSGLCSSVVTVGPGITASQLVFLFDLQLFLGFIKNI